MPAAAGSAMSDVEFRILGPLEVDECGRAVDLGAAKRRSVLAVLLVHANEAVPAGRVIDALWNESPPASASNTLQGYVSHLRRVLGSDRILSRPSGYMLKTEPEAIDARRFESLVMAARAAAGDIVRAIRYLEEGLALWRGPALAEFAHEPFAQGEAARLEELRRVASEELVDLQLALGQHQELVGKLRSLVQDQPLRERRWAQLAIALYRSGRQGEALRALAELRHHLGEELGVEPSPALCRLENDLLLQSATLDVSPALPSPTPSVARHSLPRSRSSFVGREQELEALHGLMAEGGLVTIVGPGGAGKTRLAIEVAHRVATLYAGGIWLVELAPLADPGQILAAVAVALGVPPDPGQPLLQTIIDAVGTSRALIVLDNCEHVVDAAAATADSLLAGSASLGILATSREPLRVEGELVWRIPPLPVPPVDASSPEAVVNFDAVRLFCERARTRGPFRIEAQNAPAVAELCRRLDGLPLALELAAARATMVAPAELLARIDHRFAVLTEGRRTAPARHQTLRAAVEWSYELLTSVEQTLFRRLSVFAAGFDLPSAEAGCGGQGIDASQVLDLLVSLVDRSLVVAGDAGAVTRYRLLDTLRAYAAERLSESGEQAVVRGRHLSWYGQRAELAPAFVGAVTDHASDPHGDTRDNLRQALEWALECGDIASAVSIVETCGFAYVHDGRAIVDRVLGASLSASPAVRAKALLLTGTAARARGEYADAIRTRQEALDIFRSLGDHAGVAASLHYLAAAAMTRGDYDLALAMYEECLEEWTRSGVDRAYGTSRNFVLHNLGVVALQIGDVDTASARLHEALTLARTGGEEGGVCVHIHTLGAVDEVQGRLEAAARRYEESLSLARSLGFTRSIAENLTALARLAQQSGDVRTAARLCREALKAATGDHVGTLRAVVRVASLAVGMGAASQAAPLLGAAAASHASGGRVLPVLECREYEEAIAACRIALGEKAYDQAIRSGRAWSAEQAGLIADAIALEVGTGGRTADGP